MEEFLNGLKEKVGLSDEQAEQVIEFIKNNADKVADFLPLDDIKEKLADKLPGGLGKFLG